jgi:hypothetical protein
LPSRIQFSHGSSLYYMFHGLLNEIESGLGHSAKKIQGDGKYEMNRDDSVKRTVTKSCSHAYAFKNEGPTISRVQPLFGCEG